jgi:hypothetical protein
MGRGDALDVALVHRPLGVMASPPASSERLPTHGSCNRPPAHARVASGITASIRFQVYITFAFLQQDNNSSAEMLWCGFRVFGLSALTSSVLSASVISLLFWNAVSSPQVVECPAYWPSSISVCGFWYAPVEWEVRVVHSEWMAPEAKRSKPKGDYSNTGELSLDLVDRHSCKSAPEDSKSSIQLPEMEPDLVVADSRELTEVSNERPHGSRVEETSEENSQLDVFGEKLMKNRIYKPLVKLCEFIAGKTFSGASENRDCRPIFVGLSSMGSMGFLARPGSMLKVLEAVLEATDSSAIFLTAGHLPLDLAVTELCDERLSVQRLDVEQRRNLLLEGLSCFNGRLFCYSGSVSYHWLLPQCSVAIHHGGSGTSAACLRASIPQIICPFVLDQFYWAERMTWLGVAPQPLSPQHLMLRVL